MFDKKEIFNDFAKKLTLEEVYAWSLDDSADDSRFLALKGHENNDRLWADLFCSHFGTKVFDTSRAKRFFQAEYLYNNGSKSLAAEYGSFNALYDLVNAFLKMRNYQEALSYSKKVCALYGQVGCILSLQVLQSALIDPEEEDKTVEYAQSGLDLLAKPTKFLDKKSRFYIEELGWQQTVVENHGSFKKLIEQGREFFNEKIESSRQIAYNQ
jgi:hypothetical protein